MEQLPEITLGIFHKPPHGGHLIYFSTDPCAQIQETTSSSSNLKDIAQKISFTPPLDTFPLCRFGLKDLEMFPIRGFYQMKVFLFLLFFN